MSYSFRYAPVINSGRGCVGLTEEALHDLKHVKDMYPSWMNNATRTTSVKNPHYFNTAHQY